MESVATIGGPGGPDDAYGNFLIDQNIETEPSPIKNRNQSSYKFDRGSNNLARSDSKNFIKLNRGSLKKTG